MLEWADEKSRQSTRRTRRDWLDWTPTVYFNDIKNFPIKEFVRELRINESWPPLDYVITTDILQLPNLTVVCAVGVFSDANVCTVLQINSLKRFELVFPDEVRFSTFDAFRGRPDVEVCVCFCGDTMYDRGEVPDYLELIFNAVNPVEADFTNLCCDDRAFAKLDRCTNLRKFALSAYWTDTEITNKTIKRLAKLPLLESLDLSNTSDTSRPGTPESTSGCSEDDDKAGFEANTIGLLAGCSNLQTLLLRSNVWVEAETLVDLTRIRNLSYLDISGCNNFLATNLTDISMLELVYLNMSKNEEVNVLPTDLLGACPKLESIVMTDWSSPLTCSGVDFEIDRFPSLTLIDISRCERVSPGVYIKLATCLTLRTIGLHSLPFTNDDIRSFRKLPKLRVVKFDPKDRPAEVINYFHESFDGRAVIRCE